MTELGKTLKAAREEKGLSLDDLQQLTKIQKRYLIGIEKGDYAMMPGKFYVRAFIKQYAEAVGIEPEEIFEQFKSDVPAVREDELPEQLSRVQSKRTISPTQSKVLDLLPKILVAVFVIGAAVLIWVLVSKNIQTDGEKKSDTGSDQITVESEKNSPLKDGEASKDKDKAQDNGDKNDQDQENDQDKEQNNDVKQTVSVVNSSGKFSTYELKDTDVFKLKLVASADTWVNVKNANGKSMFQGLMKQNDNQEIDLTNETKAELVIGNTAGTTIYINDEQLTYAISPTERVNQNITINFSKTE
ncbi:MULTISPECIES: helix-turn-helix domain-containing protein [Bacillus]|uniref:helix-turn-helix domain-containing protein n=1 Tax=Bacillus TaxID=1386 RepID=UPI0002F90F62|nr:MULTISPECIES: RodZ family helix-turn-helix domain-containing protein [Bacillus]